jgi:hypothetical protein
MAVSERSDSVNPEDLLAGLGLHVFRCRPISWKRVQTTPLYLVESDEGRFVLKRSTPVRGPLSRLRHLFGDGDLDTQAQVYASLGQQEFEHLRYPRLIGTDGRRYLLLEHIETRPHGESDLPRAPLLRALLEFQNARIEFARSPGAALLAMARRPDAVLVRRMLSGLRPRFGWRATRRALKLVDRCRRDQPPLDRPVVCHNDFHHNNLLLGRDGVVYFSDFEYVSLDDRWMLADIIHYAVGTGSCTIDTGIIADYADLVDRTCPVGLDLPAQLRFGLLLRVSQLILSRVPPPAVATRYGAFFSEVLLDDRAFEAWLRARFEAPALARGGSQPLLRTGAGSGW